MKQMCNFLRSFTTISFSPDGEYILAAGRSRNICIYNISEQLVVKKFTVTCNRSLDNVAVSLIYFVKNVVVIGLP